MALPPQAKRYATAHLRAARQTRGVPIATLARRFGIAVATIEAIEAGTTGWSAAETRILCRWYGLDPARIFTSQRCVWLLRTDEISVSG